MVNRELPQAASSNTTDPVRMMRFTTVIRLRRG
jgi:hypothetical protein